MLLLTLAWRNLWRHPRRTVLTAAAVALGLALVLLFLGLQDGQHAQMIESAVQMGSGHVLFQRPGYQQRRGVEMTLDATTQAEILAWSNREPPRSVRAVLPRAFVSGLLSSADGATGVNVTGIVPRVEAPVSRFVKHVEAGRFLADDDDNAAVLGHGVARVLKAHVGSKVVLMAQGAAEGEIQSRLLRVTGIVRTGLDEIDEAMLLVPLPALQELLGLAGGVHQMSLLLDAAPGSTAAARRARAELRDLDVLTWAQADPQLDAFVKIDDGGSYLFDGLFFVLIAFMVLNTLLMSVLERRREISLLGALGLSPRRRLAMVVIEATLLASLACAAGTLLGWLGHLYFAIHGLPLAWFTEGNFEAGGVILDPVMYSVLSARRIGGTIVLVFGMTMALSLIAARHARRPVDPNLLK